LASHWPFDSIGRVMVEKAMRIEHDLLGQKSIPDDAYYGVQTARAMENFRISSVPISQYPDLIRALAIVKLAAARANYDCKQFDEKILHGIERACQESSTDDCTMSSRWT
jgi:aspartate ammonia-lyase